MALSLGIDAGGTSTKAVLLDGDAIVWKGEASGGNVATGDPDAFLDALEGCPRPTAVCGAFAGLTSAMDRSWLTEVIQEKYPAAAVSVVPDYEAALEACLPEANVCVIAGTGSIVCSMHEGVPKKTGGRGYVLGDEGSGYQFGRDAMLAFLDSGDEGVSEGLLQAVESAFGTRVRSEAVAALYQSDFIPGRLASLAPALAADAESDAIYALKSLRTNMAKLAHVCRQHLVRYRVANPVLGCQGGLWKSDVYRRAFVDAVPLWCEIPSDAVKFDLPEPALGAASLAKKLVAP